VTDLVFFGAEENSITRPLLILLQTSISDRRIEAHGNLEDLERRLRGHRPEPMILVATSAGREELRRLLELEDLLLGLKLILVLEDCDPETIALGHRLRPRFLSCGDRDLWQVVEVLKRMFAQTREGAERSSGQKRFAASV